LIIIKHFMQNSPFTIRVCSTILERYLQREILEKLIWIVTILILILTSHRFVDYLGDAAAGKIPAELILKMLLMKMLAILPRLLPIALFLSVILALTRLSSDKELTAMRSSGMTDGFQLMTVFKFSIIFTSFVFIISFYLSPWAEIRVEELKELTRQQADIADISAGRFKEFSKEGSVVYVEELANDGQSMKNVFLQLKQNGHNSVLTSGGAKFHYQERYDNRYILLENGKRYVGIPGTLDYQITEYRRYGVLIDQSIKKPANKSIEMLSTGALFKSALPAHQAEFQWRLSFVLAALLLPFLAVAINKFSVGENRYLSLMMGILIYFIYSNMLGISRTLLKREDIPALVGLWWVHLILALVILISLRIQLIVQNRKRALIMAKRNK